MDSYALLLAAALGAGLMNAVAGGGSFLTFPALVFTGVPSIVANASSTVALFPGNFAAAWAYRAHFQDLEGISFRAVMTVSLAGGTSGALLLLYTPERTFDEIIPWLLLLATLVFAFGQRVSAKLRNVVKLKPGAVVFLQFLVAVYAGYFGGAVGIILLALWSLLGHTDIHAMNASKTLLGGSMNAAAVVCFIIAGKIWWPQTLTMLVGAVIGGYTGARIAHLMNPKHVRAIVIALSVTITLIFFWRT
jgi:uncharacterized membrane protein YfcA